MIWRALFPLLLLLAIFPPCQGALSAEEQKLVGQWQYETKEGEVARQVFRADGTYVAELRKEGALIRRFEGVWRLDGDMIVYTYTADSLAQIPAGTKERDKLIRSGEDYYTIEAGDHLQRTYLRVK